MMQLKINNVRISLLHECSLEQALCKKLGLPANALGQVKLLRKAVDARKKNEICLNHHVLAEVDVNKNSRLGKRLLGDRDVSLYEAPARKEVTLGALPMAAPPVVIGAGPAGLLAALELAEYGYRPLLLERGKPVAQRVTDVDRFWRTGDLLKRAGGTDAFTKATTTGGSGSETNSAKFVLLHDVKFDGTNDANVTVLVHGFVQKNKCDSTVQTLLDGPAVKALAANGIYVI